MSSPVLVNAFTSMISVNGKEDLMTELFPSNILADLDLSQSSASFNPSLTVSNPGEGLRVRPLCLEDYDRGFLELLGQLTSVGNISREEWEVRFQAMKECQGTYYVVVIEDVNLARVIGAASLVAEKKFIHSCGLVGRLEDVVVSDVYRGKQLGKLVVAVTSLLATKLGCYKITLNCNDKMIKFYNNMGYKSEDGNANYMCIRVQGKQREPQA
eukprot:TRINITY_DN60693_c0_g1_i1.p1 TRINITY_DN60693_c0_g1~~TRINITY_DN60693_c0_g1_i1.p1  ORF type:complete len:213 (-),score=79.36 TRINITY_DN60693_c0_g1_i1:91-729(-)